MYTRHKGYDSTDDSMYTHCTKAYDSNNSIVMICYYSNTLTASSHESYYMIH